MKPVLQHPVVIGMKINRSMIDAQDQCDHDTDRIKDKVPRIQIISATVVDAKREVANC